MKNKGCRYSGILNDLVKSNHKLATIKVIKAFMSNAFKQAVKDGIIVRNPFDATNLPRNTKPEIEPFIKSITCRFDICSMRKPVF